MTSKPTIDFQSKIIVYKSTLLSDTNGAKTLDDIQISTMLSHRDLPMAVPPSSMYTEWMRGCPMLQVQLPEIRLHYQRQSTKAVEWTLAELHGGRRKTNLIKIVNNQHHHGGDERKKRKYSQRTCNSMASLMLLWRASFVPWQAIFTPFMSCVMLSLTWVEEIFPPHNPGWFVTPPSLIKGIPSLYQLSFTGGLLELESQ